MNCWYCKGDLIWSGDHSYEDCDYEGDGIVSNFSCPNEDCGVEAVYVNYNCKKENVKK